MKLKVTKFKTPEIAWRELEPFVRNGQPLYTGKQFKRFGDLRPRELVGNWMICAVLNAGRQTNPFVFTTDPNGGDGIIYDREEQIGRPTEHVMVPRATSEDSRDISSMIVDAVATKQARWPRSMGSARESQGQTIAMHPDRHRFPAKLNS